LAEPTLLGDVIQPAWNALTPEQRTCWHFWAALNPVTDESGRLRTLYGAQAHYERNANLAVAEDVALLSNPPATLAPPRQVTILTVAWPIQARLEATTTARRGLVYLQLKDEIPEDTVVIVRQGYDTKLTGKGRPPRIRHVTIILPTTVGNVALTPPAGYFATTAGVNRYTTVTGITARRRPDRPLATARVVSLDTGTTVRQALTNPYGGSRTGSNRARATSVNPTQGTNHYP
jgi:hypothetical protein